MSAPPFSRLQLAAALIEYDNDNSDSETPKRSAHQSAIFSHLRRKTPARLPQQSAYRRSTDYLGVSLPTEVATRDSIAANRKSQASFNDLHNPFGRDSTVEGHAEEEELEVDLSSWGLDAFEDKGKSSKKKKKQRHPGVEEEDGGGDLPNPHPPLREAVGRRAVTSGARTQSMGNMDQMGLGGAFLDAKSTAQNLRPALGGRRASMGSPLDYADIQPVDPALQRGRRPSEHALIEGIPVTPPLHAIPFPSSGSARSASPIDQLENAYDGYSPDPRPPSRVSAFALGQPENANPFALRPPSPDRASRFDPKAQAAQMRARTVSNGTLGTQQLLNDDDFNNEYVPSVRSGVPEEAGRTRPYSRFELMRPKVLIMPSPLQPSAPAATPAPVRTADGFGLTTDGRPLPPGARTVNTRRASVTSRSMLDLGQGDMLGVPLTPDPRMNLTRSQMTFSGALSPNGIGAEGLRRAHEDGEKIEMEPEEDEVQPVTGVPGQEAATQEGPRGRPPGKLYGKSLIDDLEARKAEMKGKKRVFRGDERPSMMARTPLKRQSTLIDPESLKARPQSQRLDTYQSAPELSRRHSANMKTLINLGDEIPGAPRNTGAMGVGVGLGVGMPTGNTKSVFGVDTIWERELAKLKDIEAREAREREEEEARAREEEASGKKKKKKKGKGKDGKNDESPQLLTPTQTATPQTQAPLSPDPSGPGLSPNARRTTFFQRHPAPPPNLPADESDEESDDSDNSIPGLNARQSRIPEVQGWNSDEERQKKPAQALSPHRAAPPTSRMANLPPRLRALQESGELYLDADDLDTHENGEDPNSHHGHARMEDDDSEEDLPLVATIGRAAERATRRELGGRPSLDDDESDEDKPLVQVLDKTKSMLAAGTTTTGGLPPLGFRESLFDGKVSGARVSASMVPKETSEKAEDEDEDDKPLGLRASHAFPTSGGDEDEDDKPLAFRKSQFLSNSSNPQQQMMMQQQMMYANPNAAMSMSGMSAPFFPGPLMPQATGMSMGMGMGMGMVPAMGPMMGMGGPMMGMAPMGMGMGPMAPQILPGTPPPMQDTAKLNRVDKWRHDVAVEGDR